MYTPTRIAGREAVFEFLRHKLRAYPFIYIDINGTVAEAKMLENLSSSAVGRFHQFIAKLQLVIGSKQNFNSL